MRLIATKANKYGTRHLQAGDEFEMADRYARTLLLTGLAREAGAQVPGLGVFTRRMSVDDGLAKLRADAQGLGVTVDHRWGARRLQAEIDLALRR